MFWIILISFIALVCIFIGTQRLAEYFRDKELDLDEENRRVEFIKASEARRVEILNAINDQLFSAFNNRFGILTAIATVAAAIAIVVTFQSGMAIPLKTFASILMIAIAISLYAYAAKMEQLIKRAERFYMNVSAYARKLQYNPLRFSDKPKGIIEKIFAAIDELPVILSIAVTVSILDMILVIWH